MKKILIFILVAFNSAVSAYADTAWKSIGPSINCREFNCVVVDSHNSEVIYVGTTNGAYKTEDGGLNWERIFRGWGGRRNIRHIYIRDGKFFLCTDGGLFVSKDSGKRWKRSFGIASNSSIFSIAAINDIIFIASKDGVFKSLKGKKKWRRLFYENDDDGESQQENNESNLPKVRTIATSLNWPSRLYLGTEDGIYISEDRGETFKRFTDEGLLSREIEFIIESPLEGHKLYVVTKEGIFYFQEGWHRFESASRFRDARSIGFDLDPKNSTWITTKKGLYKSIETTTEEEKTDLETYNLLNYFSNEPTINQVQERAIRYAEVHPDKIANWRRRANISAILPRLSFGIDKSKSDNYEIYTSATKQYIVEGPTKDSDGWDITLTWDLGDLIWNGDQTLIDVRSKLMVQLRDDILDEVTSYYFERRRLQTELLEAPPENKSQRLKKELRIQELTANLDALTGGYFSRSLK